MLKPFAVIAVLLCCPNAARADDRADLLGLESRWNQAFVDHDAATLDTILAEDFLLTDGDGTVTDKATLLRNVADRSASFDPVRIEDGRVRIYGDAAVLTGRFRLTMRADGRSFTYNFRYTNVFVRKAGGWLAVSSQTTSLRAPT